MDHPKKIDPQTLFKEFPVSMSFYNHFTGIDHFTGIGNNSIAILLK